MQIERLAIPDVMLLCPKRIEDERGFFSEVYNVHDLATAGVNLAFVQDNQSLSRRKGTVRGLHFQAPPFAQAKLVRVLRGSIYDVAVDLRRGALTYGRHVGAVLSAAQGNQLLVPAGFAHGFCTLEPETEVFYKVDNHYSRAHDLGLHWRDPALGIDWPVAAAEAVLSEKDVRQPMLRDLPDYFA